MAEEDKRRKVLICMDGSKHADYAFEWYAKNVYQPNDSVIIAQCADRSVNLPPTALMGGNPSAIQAMMKEHEEEVMEKFRNIDAIANKYNIKHTLERLNGPPGESIIKAAEQQNVSMIIAGSRGQGTLRRTILGSVSDYIVHHACVPVLIAKHEDEVKKMKK